MTDLTRDPERSPASAAPTETELLRRRLARERRARTTAEQVGERATAELYRAVQQLQAAEQELRERAGEQQLLRDLARDLRSDLDTGGILRRAVTQVGTVAEADRCVIRLAQDGTIGPLVEQWSLPGVPRIDPEVPLPPGMRALCVSAAQEHESLFVDDVRGDPRLAPSEAAAVIRSIGAHSYAGTPMYVGSRLVGWLALHVVGAPRPWTRRQRVLAEGIAEDLGLALLQADAFRRKSEALRHLEQVNQVKTEVVSTVSHELRTPLSSITGYLELLRDEALGPLTDHQRRALDVVVGNAERLQALMENLLTLSRVDSGHSGAGHVEIDPGEVLVETQRALAPVLARRDLAVSIVAEPEGTCVLGDAEQLQQVMVNLLSNAIKFTPDGGSVTARLEAAPGSVVILVEDSGHGIAEEDVPHVFDRFFRARTATDHAIQGTGLGLAVVRAIVEEHGGTIELRSAVGRGTTAVVTLPSVPGPDID